MRNTYPAELPGPQPETPRPIVVPTLSELVADPTRADTLPPTVCAALVIEAGALITRLAARVALAPTDSTAGVEADRALTIEEAAARLQIAPATMQKWLRKPPYNAAVCVRSATCVRVSAHRLEEIIRSSGVRARRKVGVA